MKLHDPSQQTKTDRHGTSSKKRFWKTSVSYQLSSRSTAHPQPGATTVFATEMLTCKSRQRREEAFPVDLKGLVHRELGEGLTEEELASAVGVSVQTIANILADELPRDSRTWEHFARYFRMDADFLRVGGPPYPEGLFELTESAHPSPLGPMRKVPLLRWDQIDQMLSREELPRLIQAETLLETDVSGTRTFAVQVKDNSMQPLFSEGEIIFVNPDLPTELGHYVLVESEDGHPEESLLRQLKGIGGQMILHPLNRRYEDLPLMKHQRVWGRVVRLRKNL
jgi:transcriptional regulator with XRE-family HTH domain